MVKVHTDTKLARSMRVIGSMMFSMGEVLRRWRTVRSILVTLEMETSKVEGSMLGLMGLITRANGKTIK
jgi:hypothetical protein